MVGSDLLSQSWIQRDNLLKPDRQKMVILRGQGPGTGVTLQHHWWLY